MKNIRKYGLWERILALLIAVAMVLIPVEFHNHAHADEPQQQDFCKSYTTDWTSYGYMSGNAFRSYAASSKNRNKIVIADGALSNTSTDRVVSLLSVVKDGVDISKTWTDNFTLSVDITLPSVLDGNKRYGFVYGFGAGETFNAVVFSNNNAVGAYKDQSGTFGETATGIDLSSGVFSSGGTGKTLEVSTTHNFKIEVAGGVVKAYIDNELVRTIEGMSVGNGGVGLYMQGQYTVDNFKVELADGTTYVEDFNEGSGDTYLDATTEVSGGAAPYEGRVFTTPHGEETKFVGDADGHVEVLVCCGKVKTESVPHSEWVEGVCSVCEYECEHIFEAGSDSCSVCGIEALCREYNTKWTINAYHSSGTIRDYSSGNVKDKYLVSGGVLTILNNDSSELLPTVTVNGAAITDWTNYTASVDFNHNYRGGNTMSGIVVGKTEGTYYIVYTYYNNIRIVAVTDTAGTAINEAMDGFTKDTALVQEQTSSGVTIAAGEFHTLNVKVEGNTISAWIDESTAVATYTLPEGESLASAAPALFTKIVYNSTDATAFEAKNFKVTVGGSTYDVAFDDADGSLSADTYDGATKREGHKWSDPVVWTPDTLTHHATYCLNGCGKKKTEEHNTTVTQWDYDENNHWKVYSCCGQEVPETRANHNTEGGGCTDGCGLECSHDWVNGECTKCGSTCQHEGGQATCQNRATCEICGELYGALAQHQKSATIVFNDTHHWYTCIYQNDGCEAKLEEAPHSGTATCLNAAVCQDCPKGAHGTTDPDNHAQDGEWTRDEDSHSLTYPCCSVSVVADEPHEWVNGVCTECGFRCAHDFTANDDECALCHIAGICYTITTDWTSYGYTSAGAFRAYTASDKNRNKIVVADGVLSTTSGDRVVSLLSVVKDGVDISKTWTDNFTLSADITLPAALTGNNRYGFVYGFGAGETFNAVVFSSSTGVGAYKDMPGTFGAEATGITLSSYVVAGNTGKTLEVSTTHNFKIEVAGGVVKAYIDNELVRTIEGMSVGNGGVGLYMQGQYTVDNFKVELADGTTYVEDFNEGSGDTYLDATTEVSGGAAPYEGIEIDVVHNKVCKPVDDKQHQIACSVCDKRFGEAADHVWDDGACKDCHYGCAHNFTANPDVCSICGDAAICRTYTKLWLLNQYTSAGLNASSIFEDPNRPTRPFQVSHTVANGKLNVHCGLSHFDGNMAVFENGVNVSDGWTDYTVEVEITFPDMSGASQIGIVLRDAGNQRYAVLVGESGMIYLYKQVDEDPNTAPDTVLCKELLASGGTGVTAENDTHILKVTVSGNTITAWLDGQQAKWAKDSNDKAIPGSYTDETDPIAAGAAGIYTMGSLNVFFDNFKVTLANGNAYVEDFEIARDHLIADPNHGAYAGYEGDYVELGHDWSGNWEYEDATNHGKTCMAAGCTAHKTEAHGTATKWVNNGDGTCTEYFVCCGGVKTPAQAHAEDGEGVCQNCKNGCNHENWTDGVCDNCGYVCEHTGGEATCQKKAQCEICGKEYGELADHKWSATYSTDGDNHWKTCVTEGCTESTTPEAHFGGAANCQRKAECSKCKAAYGEFDSNIHTGTVKWYFNEAQHWQAYTCCEAPVDTPVDHEGFETGACTVCGLKCPHDFTENPEKCSICGAAGHCKSYTQYWLINQFTGKGMLVSSGSSHYTKPSHSVVGGKFVANFESSMLAGELIIQDRLGNNIAESWTDYTISVDLDLPDDQSMHGARWVAIYGRVTDTQAYVLHVNMNGYVLCRYTNQVDGIEGVNKADSIIFNDNNNTLNYRETLISKNIAGGLCINNKGNGTDIGMFNVKMTFEGKTIKVYHNDTLVISYIDESDSAIAAGYAAFSMNTKANTSLDNFVVTLADGDKYEDAFETDYDSLIMDETHDLYDGYVGTELIINHKWATEGTYKDANVHTVGCLNDGCPYKRDVAHEMQDPTCVHGVKCSGCTLETGEKNPDNHEGAPEWVTTSSKHQKKYSCCGKAVSVAEKHTWTNGKCSVCDYECAHNFTKDPDKCSICGAAGVCKSYTQYWLINQLTSKGIMVDNGSGYYTMPSHSVTGGKFVIDLEASMLMGELIILDKQGNNVSTGWKDYTVSMDVDLPDDQSMHGAKWVALFGRVTETEAYALHITSGGYTLYRYSTNVEGMEGFTSAQTVLFSANNVNSRTPLASKNIAGGLCINNKGVGTAIGTFNVKMTFEGNNIKVYHNEQLVIDYTDENAIPAGYAAFTANTGKSGTTIDEFKVALKNGPTFSDDFTTDFGSLILDKSHELYAGYEPIIVHTPHSKTHISNSSEHQSICAVCNIKFGGKEAHIWEDGSCKVCDYECKHDFTANPDKCSICGDKAVCRQYTQLWILNQYASAGGNASGVFNNTNDPTRNFQNSHEVADGKLHVSAGYTWLDGTLSVLQNGVDVTSGWTDYTVQVDITFPDMTGANAFGLVVRDSGNARYIVVVNESGGVQLRKQIDPDPTDIVDTIFYNGSHKDYVNLATATTGLTAENETRTLKVTVKGGTFTAWLDDKEVLWGPDKTAEFTDADPIASGAVGIFALGSGKDIYFDNFSVDLLEGDTYTDDFGIDRDNLIANIGHGAYNGYVGDEFILGHAWPEKATAVDANKHEKVCQHYGCGAKIVEAHSEVTDPTCSAPYGCAGCDGFGEKNPDNHEKNAAYVDNGDGTHKYYYPCCGKVVEESAKHNLDAKGVCKQCKSGCEHDWSDHDGVCNKCGYECPEHFGGEANCMSPKLCERCTTPYGEKGDHVFGKYQGENGKHWRACTTEGCTVITDEGICKGGSPTCQTQAICSVCKTGYGELREHDWSTVYTADGENHWFACKYTDCSERNGVEAHSGGAATDCITSAICEKCDESYGEPLVGVHVGEVRWKHNALNHYKAYTCCGKIVGEEGRHTWNAGVCTVCRFACVHTSATANCQENICPICGQPNGETNPDNHPGTIVWLNMGGQHKKVYSCCGKDASEPENHKYDADGYCTICTRHKDDKPDTDECVHAFDNACDTTCNSCGETREVGDHVYSFDCDSTCDICGEVRKVEGHEYDHVCDTDCNVCGEIREVNSHVYENSCDLTCEICGVYRFAMHTYDNACDGECNVCGETRDPDKHVYDDEFDADCNECGAIREVSGERPEPDTEKPDNSLIVIIVAVAAGVIAAAAVVLLIIFKKKKAAKEALTAEPETEELTEAE